jgi:hypothetical protein
MAAISIDDPVLVRFRKGLDEIYGDRLERVVLYGSRAWRSRVGLRLRCRRVLA